MFASRVCRSKMLFLHKNKPKSKAKGQESIATNPEIYDKVDEKNDYQELTEVKSTEKYTYDKLK